MGILKDGKPHTPGLPENRLVSPDKGYLLPYGGNTLICFLFHGWMITFF